MVQSFGIVYQASTRLQTTGQFRRHMPLPTRGRHGFVLAIARCRRFLRPQRSPSRIELARLHCVAVRQSRWQSIRSVRHACFQGNR